MNFGPNRRVHLKVIEFAKILRKKMNSRSKLLINKKKDTREKQNLDLDSKKSLKILNWKPVLSINQTLQLTADWYLAYKNNLNMFNFTKLQIDKFMKTYK